MQIMEERGVTHSKEEIANVMRYIHRQPHICEVKAITQPDQRQRHDMMAH